MNLNKQLILSFVAIVFGALFCSGQILVTDDEPLREDSVKHDFSNQPHFGIYKDNYFIFGPGFNEKPSKYNTNIKFQVSVSQRLTNATLPGGTYLYLFFSQKVLWNVLEESMPMTDLNFNPGIGLTKPLFAKGRYIGKATFSIEHESNGRDSIWSRSWNRVALSANVMVAKNLIVHGKIWVPIVDGENNHDLFDYYGFWQVGAQFVSNSRRFVFGVNVVKRPGWNINANTTLDVAYKVSRKVNQYLFAQLYSGYGECLMDYNKYVTQFRVGILIKPNIFNDY